MVDLLIDRRFDPEQIFAIYNGLDFTPALPPWTGPPSSARWGWTPMTLALSPSIAARLNPVKDIATLIRGFARAHAEYPPLRLLIAGDGEEMESLKKLAADLGVAKEVCFAGWVSDTDSFYHALDINTLTSISETFPYVLTEGARARLPTISSKVGGVSYLIDHGANGFLFPPGMTVRWPTICSPWPGTLPFGRHWAISSMRRPNESSPSKPPFSGRWRSMNHPPLREKRTGSEIGHLRRLWPGQRRGRCHPAGHPSGTAFHQPGSLLPSVFPQPH